MLFLLPKDPNASFWVRVSTSTYLSIIRNALTLMLPVVIAGAVGVLINNFPIKAYQDAMLGLFGAEWRMFGGYVWNGTLAVLSPVMVFTIGNSIGEHYNTSHRLDTVRPAIVGLISFCSLMAIVEPSRLVFAIPYEWVGIHGLFLAIVVSIASSELFLKLYGLKLLRVRFYSEEASVTIANAFSAMIPGILTVFAFAIFKVMMWFFGINDVHKLIYDLIYVPFKGMGNTLTTALLYNFVRHVLWFFGIHGSNAMEPVMTEIYVSAMKANNFAATAGDALPFIFTKTFFDCFISLGGAGGTLSLLAAFFIRRRDSSLTRIAQISLLPAVFNINETLLFGLPIVLNPIFAAPFILAPLITTVVAYYATLWGLVPIAVTEVAWTTPVFIGGYVATGGVAGGVLQLVNLVVGAGIYLPFVIIAEGVQKHKFERTYRELLKVSSRIGEEVTVSMVDRTDDIGSFSRALANDLLQSIKHNELFLEYQAQVNCETGEVVGLEALARWRHPRIGRIPPSLFIQLAEEIGFIKELGLWVCEESCSQLRLWQKKGFVGPVVSFNVSVKQLEDPDLPERIMDCIERYELDPGYLKVEVTESIGLSSDLGHNIVIQDIRMNGVKIAIDDFGMGHTSIVYLKKFPVSTIKLDGSLVRDVTASKISADIIYSISELCRSMGIELLAEFVETEQQAQTLRSLGCCIFQGYLYSPPISPAECEEVMRTGFRTF